MTAPVDNLMMDYPLVLTQFFERSRRLFASKTLATRRPGQPLFRYTYADFAERTLRLAGVLWHLWQVRKGERVAMAGATAIWALLGDPAEGASFTPELPALRPRT
jgi:acyl-CoA synthetase (AMP-forming)/AMP-acid ligase II